MGNYKFKLKEQRTTLKPKDVDQALIKRLEAQYGPVDMVNDFFSSDLKTYFKTDNVNPETGAINHQIIKLASFGESLQNIYKALKSIQVLALTPEGKNDKKVIETLVKVREAFNGFRTYLRKYYPDQYEVIKSQLDEISSISSTSGFTSGGEGENHTGPSPKKEAFRASQFAFGKQKKSNYDAYTQVGYEKVEEGPGATLGPGPSAGPEGVTNNVYVKDFKYKLVNQKELNKKAKGIEVKQLWEETDVETFLQDANINKDSNKKFIGSRLLAFDTIERQLNELIPLMQQAKHKTMDYYKQNPDSFSVVYGTDLAQEYLNDLIELFKQ
jgi:hypothetical protein